MGSSARGLLLVSREPDPWSRPPGPPPLGHLSPPVAPPPTSTCSTCWTLLLLVASTLVECHSLARRISSRRSYSSGAIVPRGLISFVDSLSVVPVAPSAPYLPSTTPLPLSDPPRISPLHPRRTPVRLSPSVSLQAPSPGPFPPPAGDSLPRGSSPSLSPRAGLPVVVEGEGRSKV